MIGTVIGSYRVVEKLGEGGMGAVYKAIDVMLEREVALKILRPEFAGQPELAERFRTEAIILARLNHPHIATLYGLSREAERLFMVMEFVSGETLERLVKTRGVIAPATAAAWCREVLGAMDYAHRRGVVHRDIKPANLMLTDEGAVKVMDFGIARVLGTAHQTRLGHVIGTASYMAPEQIRGQEVDARTDIYALGIVLYQLVTGHRPFHGTDEFAIMTAQVTDPPAPPSRLVPSLPAWLEAAVLRAMAKAPGDRFQSASEFSRALEAGLQTPAPADAERAPRPAAPPVPPPPPLSETRLAASPLPPTRMADAPPPTRPVDVPPPTRLAGPTGLAARLGRRGLAALGTAAIVLVGAPVAWYLSRPAAAPPEGGAQPPATSSQVAASPQPSAQAPRQEPLVGLPPTNAAPAPIVKQPPVDARRVPPTGRDSGGSPARPKGVLPEVVPPPAPAPPPAPRESEPRPAAAEEPRRTGAEPVVFDGVQMLVQGNSQVDVVLTLFGDHFTIASEENETVIKSVPYGSITSALYEETHEIQRQRTGAFGALKGAISKGGRLLGAGKHWLTVEAGGEAVVLRLGRGYEDILPVFERHAGLKVRTR